MNVFNEYSDYFNVILRLSLNPIVICDFYYVLDGECKADFVDSLRKLKDVSMNQI